MLAQAHKQLQSAANTIEQIVGVRTRQINMALRGVEVLTDAAEQLRIPSGEDENDEWRKADYADYIVIYLKNQTNSCAEDNTAYQPYGKDEDEAMRQINRKYCLILR